MSDTDILIIFNFNLEIIADNLKQSVLNGSKMNKFQFYLQVTD